MQITTHYPGDAAGGADFITGSAQGEIIDDPLAPARGERVIITDKYLEYEGRVCIGEKSVRHMANLCGMFEGERVERVAAENRALHGEVDALRAEVDRLTAALAEAQGARATVYYAHGKPYLTEDAAREASTPKRPPVKVPADDQMHENPDPAADLVKRPGILGRKKD